MGHRDGWTLAAAARRAVAVAVFAVIAVYAAEGLAIGYEFVRQLRLPRNYDRRTRLEFLADLRAQGVDVIVNPSSHVFLIDRDDGSRVSSFTSGGREFLPVAAVSRRPSVVCNEFGSYLVVRPDQYGFNNPADVWQMAPVAVAGVGDSFTFGNCVEPADSYMSRIRRAYPATVNLGITSNGPLFELATLKEYLPAVKPRVVLWFFFENDIEDVQFERKNDVLMRYVREDGFTQNLRERQTEIDRLVTEFLTVRERNARQRAADASGVAERVRRFMAVTRIHDLAQETRLNLFSGPDARVLTDEDWMLFDEILGKANAAVRSWGGRMHFVYLPTLRRFGTPIGGRLDFRAMLPTTYVDALHARVLEIARKHDLPITDLTAAFVGHPNARSELFSPVFHYTPEGNRLVADAVLAALSTDAH